MPDPVTGFTVGASVIGGGIAAKGSRDAAETQANAAREAGAVQSDVADRQLALQKQQYEEGVQRQQPFLTAGTNALARMQAGEFTPPAAFNANDPRYAQPGAFSFTANDFQASPGYAFSREETRKALEKSLAARGLTTSGGALKAAARYGEGLSSQEFGNAFNRALTQYGTNVDRSNTAFSRGLTGYNADVARADTGYNRLASMAGVGQTTTQQLNAAGANYAGAGSATLGNYGTAMGNSIMGAGNAQAAGQMGVANTLASGLQTAASSYQNQQNFNDYLASRRSMYGGGGVQNAQPYMPGLRV